MTIDELATRIDGLATKMDQKFATVDKRFETLEQKMDDGFNASKVRDEELRSLAKFGLEVNSILREEMHRNFDDADKKCDLQITILKDAVQYLSSRK